MADTYFHPPRLLHGFCQLHGAYATVDGQCPRCGTETEPEVLDKDEMIDWKNVDRLIILMSLSITERVLLKRFAMDPALRIRLLDRIEVLKQEYKEPL